MPLNKNDHRLLLLGSTGLLGTSLVRHFHASGYDVHSHSLNKNSEYQADLTNFQETNELIKKVKPTAIVNLVALTDVDLCEAHPNKSYLVNVHSIENVVAAINESSPQSHLIHISTDQVYDGAGLHLEQNISLTNYYAFSKYAAELCASAIGATVLRTNFFGRSLCQDRASITDWIFESLKSKKSIQVFDDVLFSPLSILTLSKMITLCVQDMPAGIFNLGSHGGMSKADFAFAFANRIGLFSGSMSRVKTSDVGFLKTYRPKDMRMNLLAFEKRLSIKLPQLIDEINLVAKDYYENT